MQANRAKGTLALLLAAVLLSAAFSCAPSRNSQSGADQLELTDDMIRERLNGAFIRDVPEETGSSPSIGWRFFQSEPKEVVIVDKQIEGGSATVILDIKTRSSPRSREQRSLAGQIRTTWAIERGMVLRQWQIVQTENISLKYKDLPKLTEDNSDRSK